LSSLCLGRYFSLVYRLLFFFTDTATTEIYTLSLHDALPISANGGASGRWPAGRWGEVSEGMQILLASPRGFCAGVDRAIDIVERDRKSTRLNSSHVKISYAVFCLKKKKQ